MCLFNDTNKDTIKVRRNLVNHQIIRPYFQVVETTLPDLILIW